MFFTVIIIINNLASVHISCLGGDLHLKIAQEFDSIYICQLEICSSIRNRKRPYYDIIIYWLRAVMPSEYIIQLTILTHELWKKVEFLKHIFIADWIRVKDWQTRFLWVDPQKKPNHPCILSLTDLFLFFHLSLSTLSSVILLFCKFSTEVLKFCSLSHSYSCHLYYNKDS